MFRDSLGIYGGAQGIWVNKARTALLSATGVTVSLLHTGQFYADDLTDEGVLYHYPKTNRPKGRDLSEIEATKAMVQLHLPVFVITSPTPKSHIRDVYLGWVEGWDDNVGLFFVLFGDKQPALVPKDLEDDMPFELVDRSERTKHETSALRRSPLFKFLTFRRYGLHCAVCDISVAELLDAAHIRPKNEGGSDDPRNGLVLCPLHHRALDAGFFAIEPDTLKVNCIEGINGSMLLIKHEDLNHLRKKPHRDTLVWLWRRWKSRVL